jgi:hypothetical protein
MIRLGTLAVLTAWVILVPAAPAQTPAVRFHWQTGQVLVYKFEQVLSVTDVVEETRAESTTKLSETKRWQVLEVDAAGVATVRLSLTSLRYETTTPGGDVLKYDSASPDQSAPELREQVGKYVNQPLAVLRVDSKGKVLEVKQSEYGPASHFESELPFILILPDELKSGQAWERGYQVTLEPPQGTGEKYPAMQKLTCKALDAKTATIGLSTMITKMPDAAVDRLPLLPFQAEGEVVFDVQGGFLRSAKLQIDREVAGYQGEASSYRFKGTSTEEYVGDK